MFQALFNSLSGLFSYSKALDTVSNNVANMNTPGFRGSDTFFENVGSEFGSRVAGQGVRTTQGLFTNTGNATDLAINGNGYFVLQDASGNLYYTRAGQFTFNAKGVLTDTANGYDVMSIDASGNLSPIDKTSYASLPGQPTTTINMVGNIVPGQGAFTGAYQNLPDLNLPDVQIFDASGTQRTLKITLTDNSASTLPTDYSFNVTVRDANGNVIGNPTGVPQVITFDPFTGKPTVGADTVVLNFTFAGQAQNVTLKFSGATVESGVQANPLAAQAADGRGSLAANFSFDVNGVLQVTYSTTESKQGPQIALASFASDDALHMIGGRLIAASSVQHPVFGHANTGVFGSITGGSLEQSNVDLTQEFAQMIIIQRGYQASSKVMTVSNQMLEELYNGQSGG